MKECVSFKEACELLEVGRTTMYALINTGRVKSQKTEKGRAIIATSLLECGLPISQKAYYAIKGRLEDPTSLYKELIRNWSIFQKLTDQAWLRLKKFEADNPTLEKEDY